MFKVTELVARLYRDRWVVEMNQSGKFRFQGERNVRSV